MDLYKEILAHAMTYGEIKVSFPGQDRDLSKIVEGDCYKALQKIKAVIEDDSLEDTECFMKIEEIIRIFEEMGCSCGSRHDFG